MAAADPTAPSRLAEHPPDRRGWELALDECVHPIVHGAQSSAAKESRTRITSATSSTPSQDDGNEAEGDGPNQRGGGHETVTRRPRRRRFSGTRGALFVVPLDDLHPVCPPRPTGHRRAARRWRLGPGTRPGGVWWALAANQVCPRQARLDHVTPGKFMFGGPPALATVDAARLAASRDPQTATACMRHLQVRASKPIESVAQHTISIRPAPQYLQHRRPRRRPGMMMSKACAQFPWAVRARLTTPGRPAPATSGP